MALHIIQNSDLTDGNAFCSKIDTFQSDGGLKPNVGFLKILAMENEMVLSETPMENSIKSSNSATVGNSEILSLKSSDLKKFESPLKSTEGICSTTLNHGSAQIPESNSSSLNHGLLKSYKAYSLSSLNRVSIGSDKLMSSSNLYHISLETSQGISSPSLNRLVEVNNTPYNSYLQFIKQMDKDSGDKLQRDGTEFHSTSHNMKARKRVLHNTDIFGNNMTSRYLNKFTVDCPHCERRVCARRFVRHLEYCMGINGRKRTTKSYKT